MARWEKLRVGFGVLLVLSAVSVGLFFAFLEMSVRRHIVGSQDLFHASHKLFSLTDPMTIQAPLESRNEDFYIESSRMQPAMTKRQILLIVAHGRSGSTFLASIFNKLPRVFYVFEPLHGIQRRQPKDYDKVATNLLYHIFQCDFSVENSTRDIGRFFRSYSRALSSPPFCKYKQGDPRWKREDCLPVKKQALEHSCKVQHNTIVYKLLLERIPSQSIEKLFKVCEMAGMNCKVIYLVRDIRPVVMSSQKVAFFREVDRKAKSSMRQFVYSHCQMTETNLQLIKYFHPALRSRVKLVRYEDLATEPIEVVKFLYEFVEFELSEDIKKWILNITQPNVNNLKAQKRNPVSVVRNSLEVLNKWRLLADSCYIDVIERYCRDVMRLMGYIATEGSVEMLRNISTPLFTDSYPAQNWTTE